MLQKYGRPPIIMRCSSTIFLLLLCVASGHCVPSNRTIDDQKGDSVTGLVPTYNTGNGTYGTANKWNIGQTCTTCLLHSGDGVLDPGKAFDGTWHDASRDVGPNDPDVSMRMDFTGTAVYVYNILANTVDQIQFPTNLEFYMDGDQVGTFTHVSDGTTQIHYNVLVYQNTTLSNAQHSLLAVMTGSANSTQSFFLFDYAIYTVEEPDAQPSSQSPTSSLPVSSAPPSEASPSKRTNTTAIVGGVVGSVVALVALLLCLYLIHRLRVRRRPQTPGGGPAVPAQVQPRTKGHDRMTEVGSVPGDASDGELQSGETGKLQSREDTGWFHGLGPATVASTLSPSPESRAVNTPSIAYGPASVRVASSPIEPTAAAQLAEQIQHLQAQVTQLRATRSTSLNISSDAERSLSAELAELAAFRGTMAALRAAEVGEPQQYAGVSADTRSEPPPSYE